MIFKKEKYKKGARIKKRSKKKLWVVLNAVLSFFILFPLIYAICLAFMPSSELFSMEMNLWPQHPTLYNFSQAVTKVPLTRFILNSFIVAGTITLGQIFSCAMAAFSFTFLQFRGKKLLFLLVMATMMIPGEATILSNYLTVGRWGWLDTYAVLIVPYLTGAMGIFLFRQFFKTFPYAVYEAAKMDGCSDFRFLWTILMPLSKSAVGAMSVYSFVNAWNMFMWPLLVTGSDRMRTVQIGIAMLDSVESQAILTMIAGVVLIILPSISIFIVGQKQLVKGLFSGAVKG